MAGRVIREGQICAFYPYEFKKPEITAKAPWAELCLLARGAVNGKEIQIKEEEDYRRLAVYAVVREKVRDPQKVYELRQIVQSLDSFTLLFWFTQFCDGKREKAVKAFRILYGL